MAERERTPVGWDAWLGWVAASSVGLTIGLVVYLVFAAGDRSHPEVGVS